MNTKKPIPSIPGAFAYSDGSIQLPTHSARGRVYSNSRTFGNISKSSVTSKHLYRNLYTRKWGNLKIHRLVCEAFHGARPSDSSVVIHINEDGLDNRPCNLKWGTQKENLNMPKFIAYCKSRTGKNSPAIKGKK